MWPFSKKKIPFPYSDIASQLDMALKSFSLPEVSPNWKLFSQRQTDWLPQVAINEGYKASAVVYAAVEKRAKLIASVPWKAQRRKGDDWEDVGEGDPLQELLERPNPDQSMYEFMYGLSQSADLAGNAFISEVKAGRKNQPQELWMYPAKYMKIAPGKVDLVEYYEYDNQGVKRKIPTEDMIQIRMPNPDSPYWGMPPLMAAGQATDIDREAGAFQKVSLQNRGLSDLHVQLPDGSTPEQADYVRDKLKERNQTPANARAPLVSSGQVKQLNQTAAEMDFVNSRKAVWAEIAAVFGVPLATMGFTEDVNLANAEAMDKQLWQNTIVPQLELIKRQLNHGLAKEFYSSPERRDVRIVYDLSNVTALQEDLTDKLDNAKQLWGMGVPFNVLNQKMELGFDDITGGDIGYLPTGVLPAGFEGQSSVEPEEEIPDNVKQMIKALCYGDTENKA